MRGSYLSTGGMRSDPCTCSSGGEPFDLYPPRTFLPTSPLMAPELLFNMGGLTVRLPFPSLPQTSTNAMAQKDHLPLVFKFGEVDSEPMEIQNKEEWGLMDMAQNELAMAVAAPAPIPAPIHAPAPATIPVALTGWSPSTIAELEAAGVRRSPRTRASLCTCQRPCPCAPLHPSRRRSPCVWLHPPRP